MRLRTLAEWLVIIIPLFVITVIIFIFVTATPETGSGLSGNGGFFQSPLTVPQQWETSSGDWKFTLSSKYAYTLAGRVIGRHEYPQAMPDGIVPLDLGVANGDLLKPGILSYFTFTMGDHTLKYSYDVPNFTGLTADYIDEHISNNHLVFLNESIESEVKNATVNSCMIINGTLLDIKGTSSHGSQYLVQTSTVRNDSYPAGCEIILVQSYTPVSCGN